MEFPLAFGLEKTGLPLIITSGKLKNLCFLIDTGATHNSLFSFVYEHFKDEFKTLSKTQNLMGIEGHYKETPVIEATFNFEGTDYTSTSPYLMQLMQLRKYKRKQVSRYMGCWASSSS